MVVMARIEWSAVGRGSLAGVGLLAPLALLLLLLEKKKKKKEKFFYLRLKLMLCALENLDRRLERNGMSSLFNRFYASLMPLLPPFSV